MADFRLSRPKKTRAAAEREDLPLETKQSILQQAGGAALSGLHTVGSLLSAPSRLVHGTINAVTGGEGGFGSLNPWDSTGGIEGSHHLVRMGLLPPNDPNKWEVFDAIRGAADVALDPTTWLAPVALTKAGVAASKIGKGVTGGLERGVVNQIRAGQRGLVGVQLPFGAASHGAFGTGSAVADAVDAGLKRSRIGPLAAKIAESAPARHFNALMRAPFAGKIHKSIQKFAVGSDEARRAAHRANELDIAAMVTKHKNSGFTGKEHGEIFRDILEGIPNPKATPEHIAHAAEMKRMNDAILANDLHHGIATGPLQDDDVQHFVRRMLTGVGGNDVVHGWEMAANKAHGREDLWKQLGGTNSINRILQDADAERALQSVAHLGTGAQTAAVHNVLTQKYGFDPDKLEEIARIMTGPNGEAIRAQGLFGNHPLHDLQSAAKAGVNRQHAAQLAYNAIGDEMHWGPHGVKIEDFLNGSGFNAQQAAHHISQITGRPIHDVLGMHISDDLASELKSLTPGFRAPPAAKNVWDTIKSLSTIWKASTLAMPASRMRDFASGAIQNAMMGHSGLKGWNEARNIAHGAKLAGDYSHLPEVADLMGRHGLSHDDAVKAILSVEAPRSAGFVADTVPGQVGSTLEDMIANIPGHEKSGTRDVLRRAAKSFVRGELDRAGKPISKGRVFNPANVSGAFGKESTAYGPAAASNVVSGATDEFNRHAGILGQMAQGANPSVAGKATRAAQVDYDPTQFSGFERSVLKQLFPFYSYARSMTPHTAAQLLNPGGRLAQLVKAEDRAHGQDPSLPDSVLAGAAIPFPFGAPDDGTKRLVTQLGTMPENAVNTLGNLASLTGEGLQSAGYGVLASLNPLARLPIERTVGKSFFKKGADEKELTPNVGQILADIGTHTGLRDAEAGPIRYPGSNTLETAIQLSPLSRAVSSTRTLTDTRKGIGEKAANLLSGVRLQDVSPKSQTYQLIKRAEKLAEQSGAKLRTEAYFSKASLDELEKVNPELAAKQRAIQKLMNDLRGKKKAAPTKEKKPAEFRLGKRQ